MIVRRRSGVLNGMPISCHSLAASVRLVVVQSSELVELAAVVSRRGPSLLAGSDPQKVAGIEDYWAVSKCRFERWNRALGRMRRTEEPVFDIYPGTVRGLFEEMLGSEVLTRIWTATVTAYDRLHEADDNEIVVRSVFIGHLEMRQRLLQALWQGNGFESSDAVALNRLRRRAELWTDMLLAPLALGHSVDEFAFESERLRQFKRELDPATATLASNAADRAALLETSIRSAIGLAFNARSPNADLNAQLAASIIRAFAADQFDDCGVLRSLWMMRLASTADDTQRLLDELFRQETVRPGTTTHVRRFG
ncbi:MAG: hypothetical protein JNL96_06005 [Planctomycetaceae bacterium]|nr:hypothetical protein [Planctomycetaceae bacterium]